MSHPCKRSRIRLARAIDACDISLLSRSEIEHGLPWAWRPETVAGAIANPNMNVIVTTAPAGASPAFDSSDESSMQLTGFALVYFGRTHAHVELLAVQRGWRRQGIGRELLDWQVESARTAGIRHLTLEVRKSNAAAQAFYRDCGFEARDTVGGYYNNREDALRMSRKLEVLHES